MMARQKGQLMASDEKDPNLKHGHIAEYNSRATSSTNSSSLTDHVFPHLSLSLSLLLYLAVPSLTN